MKIGLAVIKTNDFDINHNLNMICDCLRSVKNKCDYIFLGESVLNGFDGLTWKFEEDFKSNAISQTSSFIKRIAECAVYNSVNIGFGYYEKGSNAIFDSYMIVSKFGEIIENYRRLSTGWKINNADSRYMCGAHLKEINLDTGKAIFALCGDLWDKANINKFIESSTDKIIWPVFIDYSKKDWKQTALFEYQNQIKMINKKTFLINSISNGKSTSHGGAYYFSENGNIIEELYMDKENVLIIDI